MKESLALGKQGLHGQSGKVGGNILGSIISTRRARCTQHSQIICYYTKGLKPINHPHIHLNIFERDSHNRRSAGPGKARVLIARRHGHGQDPEPHSVTFTVGS